MSKQIVTELEALFTADTEQVEAAFKRVKDGAEKVEKAPVKAKVDADVRGALDGMDRVHHAARKVVSGKTVATVDANIDRAEKNIARTKERLDYLRSVETDLEVGADIKRAETALARAERQRDALLDARAFMEIDADTKAALAKLADVDAAGQRIVSADVVARVDADISTAEKNVVKIQAQLEVLRSTDVTSQVLVDITRAEDRLGVAEKKLAGLRGARAVMEVDADTSPAESALDEVGDVAGEAGDDAGAEFGTAIIAALATIPIAGAVVGTGAAAAKGLIGAFRDGLEQERGRDRLQALTGVDEPTARRLSAAAAEAYATGFGESIESNMDAVRAGVQFDLIDADASTRASSKVVEGLAGIADALGEDVQPVARTVTTMLRAGIVDSADAAFDVLATGAREGVNVAEDLLDTFDEYSPLFARLGLQGPEALGLMSQALDGGARDADKAADALKEFQIRATDGSKSSAEGFKLLGLDAKEMTEQIAAGGDGARDGLEKVLTELGKMEAGADRTTAATALFGTQAEDLGDALFAMDLSSAVSELDGVNGAARKMFDTMASNDASKVEQALRNIEVAGDGVKGALAAAFAEPLGDFADWVSSNRGPLLEFFAGLVNGAIDFAQTANTAVGSFVSGPLAEMMDALVAVADFMNGPLEGAPEGLVALADGMRGFDDTTDGANQKLEQMRGEFNEFADAQVALGYVHDAAMRTADAVGEVGLNADGTALAFDKLDGSNLKASQSVRKLEEQVKAAIGALDDEIAAADAAGESQGDLESRYKSTTGALSDQLQEMGLTKKQAKALIDTYAEIPEKKTTEITAEGLTSALTSVEDFQRAIGRLPTSKNVTITTYHKNGLNAPAATGGYGADLAAAYLAGGGQARRRYTGLLNGPGTPTSDSIPAWLSTKEFVQNAAATSYYGTDFLYALNARAIPREYFEALGFAGGGTPGNGVSVPSSGLRDLLASLQMGAFPVAEISAFGSALKSATRASDKAAVSADQHALALSTASKSLALAEKDVAKAKAGSKAYQRAETELAAAQKAVDPRSALGQNRTALRDLKRKSTKGLSKSQKAAREKQIDALQKKIDKAEDKRNLRIAEARDKLDWESEKRDKAISAAEKKLTKAKSEEAKWSEKNTVAQQKAKDAQDKATKIADDLAAAHQKLADAARQVSEQYASNYMSGGDLADTLANMKEGAELGTAFAAKIEKLRALGLSEDVIQQAVIGQGEVWGADLADEIIKGGKPQVAALNSAAAKLDKVADRLGMVQAVGVQEHAIGGRVYGPGSATSDSVLMAASNGEYVVKASSAQAIGYDNLDYANATGRLPAGVTVTPAYQTITYTTHIHQVELPGVKTLHEMERVTSEMALRIHRSGAR